MISNIIMMTSSKSLYCFPDDHVVSLLDVLTGSPLYLDTDSIRTLLCSIPDQLVWNEDPECLRSHLMTLASLFRSVKECMEKVWCSTCTMLTDNSYMYL